MGLCAQPSLTLTIWILLRIHSPKGCEKALDERAMARFDLSIIAY